MRGHFQNAVIRLHFRSHFWVWECVFVSIFWILMKSWESKCRRRVNSRENSKIGRLGPQKAGSGLWMLKSQVRLFSFLDLYKVKQIPDPILLTALGLLFFSGKVRKWKKGVTLFKSSCCPISWFLGLNFILKQLYIYPVRRNNRDISCKLYSISPSGVTSWKSIQCHNQDMTSTHVQDTTFSSPQGCLVSPLMTALSSLQPSLPPELLATANLCSISIVFSFQEC